LLAIVSTGLVFGLKSQVVSKIVLDRHSFSHAAITNSDMRKTASSVRSIWLHRTPLLHGVRDIFELLSAVSHHKSERLTSALEWEILNLDAVHLS